MSSSDATISSSDQYECLALIARGHEILDEEVFHNKVTLSFGAEAEQDLANYRANKSMTVEVRSFVWAMGLYKGILRRLL